MAKQLVTRTLGRARDKALELIERYRLEGAVRMVRRVAGWAATGLGLLRRGFEIVGMASAVGWVIASPTARNLLSRAAGAAAGLFRRVGQAVASVGSKLLALFGSPGRAVTACIFATAPAREGARHARGGAGHRRAQRRAERPQPAHPDPFLVPGPRSGPSGGFWAGSCRSRTPRSSGCSPGC